MKGPARVEEFEKLDIRVGEVRAAAPLEGARVPAYKLEVDFGGDVGVRSSSARLTELYAPEDLVGRQVLGVVNFPPLRVAGFASQVLVLGVYAEEGVVLVQPERTVRLGDRLG